MPVPYATIVMPSLAPSCQLSLHTHRHRQTDMKARGGTDHRHNAMCIHMTSLWASLMNQIEHCEWREHAEILGYSQRISHDYALTESDTKLKSMIAWVKKILSFLRVWYHHLADAHVKRWNKRVGYSHLACNLCFCCLLPISSYPSCLDSMFGPQWLLNLIFYSICLWTDGRWLAAKGKNVIPPGEYLHQLFCRKLRVGLLVLQKGEEHWEQGGAIKKWYIGLHFYPIPFARSNMMEFIGLVWGNSTAIWFLLGIKSIYWVHHWANALGSILGHCNYIGQCIGSLLDEVFHCINFWRSSHIGPDSILGQKFGPIFCQFCSCYSILLDGAMPMKSSLEASQ
jgi:hypothetical protein